jgi:hypothetical protein
MYTKFVPESLKLKIPLGTHTHRLDASVSGWGSVEGSCEHGNEPSGSIRGGEFID